MLLQTLEIEANSGSRERSQRAELGEPLPRFAAPPPSASAAARSAPAPASAAALSPPRAAVTASLGVHRHSPQCALAPCM